MSNKCLIFGGGQIASYLIDLLTVWNNIPVIVVVRDLDKYDDLSCRPNVTLHEGDIKDPDLAERLISYYNPLYVINCASLASVSNSWDEPIDYINTNFTPILYQLEAIKKKPWIRYANLGSIMEFHNESPYAVSKSSARTLIELYKNRYGLYLIQPWLDNTESLMRSDIYVSRKITKGVARIFHALKDGHEYFQPISLGNLDAVRGWIHAANVARGIWDQLNQDNILGKKGQWPICGMKNPDENRKRDAKKFKSYILSGERKSIKNFVEEAFRHVGIQGKWVGEGLDEIYLYTPASLLDGDCGPLRALVKIDSNLFRPLDTNLSEYDSSEITNDLGWYQTISFSSIIKEMVEYDILTYK